VKFGLFGGAQAYSAGSKTPGSGFHDWFEFNVEAEALGLHSTFCVEHHFTGWSQISATLDLLTWHDDAGNQAAIYGTPDEIVPKLEALRAVGVTYVLGNFGGTSRPSLQRFAREILPALD
jgi:alkanesulfonate monooxygenase SsuD/methylene tetrahydromethanopterin reductase-like flavin-dependent oxidoreductase (luciferase family)